MLADFTKFPIIFIELFLAIARTQQSGNYVQCLTSIHANLVQIFPVSEPVFSKLAKPTIKQKIFCTLHTVQSAKEFLFVHRFSHFRENWF